LGCHVVGIGCAPVKIACLFGIGKIYHLLRPAIPLKRLLVCPRLVSITGHGIGLHRSVYFGAMTRGNEMAQENTGGLDDLLATSIFNDPPKQQQKGLSIPQALAHAKNLMDQGRLSQAEVVLKQVLQATPQNAVAYHMLGLLAHQANNTPVAIELLQKAIELDGTQASYLSNCGEMCRLLERLDEAIEYGTRATEVDPNAAGIWCNLGIAYFDQKDFEKAQECQAKALSLNPEFPNALNNMGSILREQDDIDGAIEHFKKAMAVAPDYVEPFNNLGSLYATNERPEEGIAVLTQALEKRKDYPEAYCNLGYCYKFLEQNEKALHHFSQALSFRSVYPEAHLGMGGVRREMRQFEEAEALLALGLAQTSDHMDLTLALASIKGEMGKIEESEALYKSAQKLDPESIPAQIGNGMLWLEQGETDRASGFIRKALELNPDSPEAAYALTRLKRFKENDPDFELLKSLEKAINDPSKSRKRIQARYGLGKAYDDSGDHSTGFKHYMEGAALKRETFEYSASHTTAVFDSVMKVFTPELLNRDDMEANTSKAPIFILGMPRSGTTLTEQIISSHPDVFGAGELPDFEMACNAWGGKKGDRLYPSNIHQASTKGLLRKAFQDIGNTYIEQTSALANGEARTTDKMPANFLFIGAIKLALPNAKIIHINRNPIDTCVSNFVQLFGHNQYQSYELEELGLYYRDYKRLMAYWRENLPAGTFYDLHYEELVADTEGEARKMLDYLDLEWDPACLDYANSKRQVRTSSLTQVREPIYTRSVERWRKYEEFLGPLIEAIDRPHKG
jgi:tetratricopeptide (TPR) repeat protein